MNLIGSLLWGSPGEYNILGIKAKFVKNDPLADKTDQTTSSLLQELTKQGTSQIANSSSHLMRIAKYPVFRTATLGHMHVFFHEIGHVVAGKLVSKKVSKNAPSEIFFKTNYAIYVAEFQDLFSEPAEIFKNSNITITIKQGNDEKGIRVKTSDVIVKVFKDLDGSIERFCFEPPESTPTTKLIIRVWNSDDGSVKHISIESDQSDQPEVVIFTGKTILAGKANRPFTTTSKFKNSLIYAGGPIAGMAFSGSQLVVACALRKFITLPIASAFGIGGLAWMTGELLYSATGKCDWHEIASNSSFHLAAARTVLVSQFLFSIMAAYKLF